MRTSSLSRSLRATAGFSLVEVLVAMAIFTMIMGATMAGLADVTRGNDTVLLLANMNNSVRSGMDYMVRDLLQVGSGLPASHAVTIPSGSGSTPVKIPGPPGTNFATAAGALSLPAVLPLPGQGHPVNGVATDVVVTLMADNALLNVNATAATSTSVTLANGPVIDTGPDRVVAGQLMLIQKGSQDALVQVTAVSYPSRVLTFNSGDSLNLNQPSAASGNLASLNAAAPANTPSALRISRVRMVTYYIDATTTPANPRLVRRVNNGSATSFNNNSGTAMAMDVTNLQFTYDISNGNGNPGNVEMNTSDIGGTGACAPNACAMTQIRKVNIALTGRTNKKVQPSFKFMTNTLESQVSLRGMAFVDRYR